MPAISVVGVDHFLFFVPALVLGESYCTKGWTKTANGHRQKVWKSFLVTSLVTSLSHPVLFHLVKPVTSRRLSRGRERFPTFLESH